MIIVGAERKSRRACCPGCKSGKPCCGDSPSARQASRFEQHGGLWLPKPRTSRRRRREALAKLDLPRWPRDRDFILRVENLMPVKRVGTKYGDPVHWGRQMNAVRAMLSDPFGLGERLRPWLPAYMPQYDMSCTGCCATCCCDFTLPVTLRIDIAIPSGSGCESCGDYPPGPVDEFVLTSTSDPIVCDQEPGEDEHWFYQGFGSPCDPGTSVEGCIMCGLRSLSLECGAGFVELIEDNVGSDGDPGCGGAGVALDVESCEPFHATASWTVEASDVECICNGDAPLGDETWEVDVHE